VPRLIEQPTTVPAAGQPPKIIREYIGRVNSETTKVSVARMTSPSGWVEPGQRPKFDEYTLVLNGSLRVESEDGSHIDVAAGQAVIVPGGEWVRYSTPHPNGAEYVAICVPAFSMEAVNRDDE